eukprot:scaffold83634_cov66-Phaeocystis_antarctica.AAC.6
MTTHRVVVVQHVADALKDGSRQLSERRRVAGRHGRSLLWTSRSTAWVDAVAATALGILIQLAVREVARVEHELALAAA